ncbi:MAG: hypothetical protein K2X77_09905 [Candidatus Obscuribacterales bacterium]|nr:hypothetical protein [Candidatus Obscuribacterales bacterium]
MKNKRRTNKGTVICEAGPALFILIIFMFFPMLDILGLGLASYSGYMLNTWQTREAALLNANEAQAVEGQIMKSLPEYWRTNGLGALANVQPGIQTEVVYEDGVADSVLKADKVVHVTTTIQYAPWFTVPFFDVPGLGKPFPITFSNRGHVEDPDLVTNQGAQLPNTASAALSSSIAPGTSIH